MLNHCILRKHTNKESRVSVGEKTTSLRNADLKMMQIERVHCQGAQKEGSNLAYRAELEETISSVCGNWRTNSKQSRRRIQSVPISQEKPEPSIMLPVKVNGEDCSMELETGASVSIMSEEAWKKRFPKAPLEKSTLKLRTCLTTN